MARVTGIGGFFFRSQDPTALNRWYAEHLGVVMLGSRTYEDAGWFQDRGETVFFACEPESEMLGAPEKSWTIAELDDPEGNHVQLWEPNAASVARDPGPDT